MNDVISTLKSRRNEFALAPSPAKQCMVRWWATTLARSEIEGDQVSVGGSGGSQTRCA
jgi:hypothetical protein